MTAFHPGARVSPALARDCDGAAVRVSDLRRRYGRAGYPVEVTGSTLGGWNRWSSRVPG